MMRNLLKAMVVGILLPSAVTCAPAYAACDRNDAICNDYVNNKSARQKASDNATTQKYNQQNGTSQYTGPTGGMSSGGTPYVGYKKSIP